MIPTINHNATETLMDEVVGAELLIHSTTQDCNFQLPSV
jgi:hypothetical protein